ncbi:MAG: zinc metallopeptidase [Clostridiales bacterium]|nr:zinc metallopeptidase [Clostridiales bacterium]
MFYFWDWTYVILLPAIVLSLVAQMRVTAAYNRYSQVKTRRGITAEMLVREMFNRAGLMDVKIEMTHGKMSDHYDPRSRTLRLSEGVMHSDSVAALGIAAHEAGHALQHRDEYGPLTLRNASVATVNIGSSLSWPLVLLGIVLSFEPVIYAGIALFSVVVLFSLITLPVEFNASRRALQALEGGAYLDSEELKGARSVLSAAALTYVASALTAILQLVRLIAISGVGRRRD